MSEGKRGRPRKHSAWDLEVGKEIVIPCCGEAADRLRRNILGTMRPSRTGIRVTTSIERKGGEIVGLRVRRVE